MQRIQAALLSAALFVGTLTLSPLAATIQDSGTTAPTPHSKLFPTPGQGLVIRGQERETLAQLLAEFSAVTGEHVMYAPETAKLLQNMSTQLIADLAVAPEDVYSVVQDVLFKSRFVVTDVRRTEPRMLSVASLDLNERSLVRQSARYVPIEEVADYARDSAMLITTLVDLPSTDLRQVGNSLRTLVTDQYTTQLIALPESGQMMVTGFAGSVNEISRMLQRVDQRAQQAAQLRAEAAANSDKDASAQTSGK